MMYDTITIKLSDEIFNKMLEKGIRTTEGQVEFIRNAMALMFYATEDNTSIYIKAEGQKELVELDMEVLKQ